MLVFSELGAAYGVIAENGASGTLQVTNAADSLIGVQAGTSAYGISTVGMGGTTINQAGIVDAVGSYAIGITAQDQVAVVVTNASTGTITVTGSDDSAFGIQTISNTSNSTITNNGMVHGLG